jgi:aspartyl protease family protein
MRQILFSLLPQWSLPPDAARHEPGRNAPAVPEPTSRVASAPQQQQTSAYRTVTVRGDARGALPVEGSVDGRRLDFMVDTGASVVRCASAMRRGSASIRIPRDYTASVVDRERHRSSAAPVQLNSLEVGGIRVHGVRAMVLPDQALSENLLGMSFLSRVRRFEVAKRPPRDGTIMPYFISATSSRNILPTCASVSFGSQGRTNGSHFPFCAMPRFFCTSPCRGSSSG